MDHQHPAGRWWLRRHDHRAGAHPITTRQRLVYWLALAVGAGAVVSVYLLLRSRLGLALMAPVRDNTIAAESVGVDVFRNRLRVHLIGAVG